MEYQAHEVGGRMRAMSLVELCRQIDSASTHMLTLIGKAALQESPADLYPGAIVAFTPYTDDLAVSWARIAGHYANRLIDLAELGERA